MSSVNMEIDTDMYEVGKYFSERVEGNFLI